MTSAPSLLALGGVILTAAYLVVFGLCGWFLPAGTARFLRAFAGSFPRHGIELLARLLAGVAFIIHAPSMRWPLVFVGLGGVLVITTVALALIPWTWHRRIAERSVPRALRFLPLLAGVAVAAGSVILFATFRT